MTTQTNVGGNDAHSTAGHGSSANPTVMAMRAPITTLMFIVCSSAVCFGHIAACVWIFSRP